ncbi:MAG: methyl-accepting chemotaxis protein, partial [Aeromonas sobria]
MTQSLLGKLFGHDAAEARQQALLLDAIGQVQSAIVEDRPLVPIDLSGLDNALRTIGNAVNDVVTLLSDKLEQSRDEVRNSQALLHENRLVRKALDCASTNV